METIPLTVALTLYIITYMRIHTPMCPRLPGQNVYAYVKQDGCSEEPAIDNGKIVEQLLNDSQQVIHKQTDFRKRG